MARARAQDRAIDARARAAARQHAWDGGTGTARKSKDDSERYSMVRAGWWWWGQVLVFGLGLAAGFAAVAGYCFVLIARTCRMTRASTFTCAEGEGEERREKETVTATERHTGTGGGGEFHARARAAIGERRRGSTSAAAGSAAAGSAAAGRRRGCRRGSAAG